MSEQDQRLSGGMSEPPIGDLHAPQTLEHRVVENRPVAHHESLAALGHDLRHHVVRGVDRRLADPLHPTEHAVIAGVEHLAAAGVDHRRDDAAAVAQPVGDEVEALDRHHRHPQRVGDRYCGGNPHPQAGVEPGSDIHGHRGEVTQRHIGVAAGRLDLGSEKLGVAPVAGGLH